VPSSAGRQGHTPLRPGTFVRDARGGEIGPS
jgi:hypothetical protein